MLICIKKKPFLKFLEKAFAKRETYWVRTSDLYPVKVAL